MGKLERTSLDPNRKRKRKTFLQQGKQKAPAVQGLSRFYNAKELIPNGIRTHIMMTAVVAVEVSLYV